MSDYKYTFTKSNVLCLKYNHQPIRNGKKVLEKLKVKSNVRSELL